MRETLCVDVKSFLSLIAVKSDSHEFRLGSIRSAELRFSRTVIHVRRKTVPSSSALTATRKRLLQIADFTGYLTTEPVRQRSFSR